MTNLRWYKGKQLVSFLRNGDYAHAGETEAILKVMSKFPKKKKQSILDVGCGRGGTANFIQKHSWGNVTGIDIEESSVKYAKSTYPDISFFTSDVLNAANILQNKTFDIICLFNAFYAFNNQLESLKILRTLAKSNTKLAINEYTDLSYPKKNPFTDITNKNAVSIPVSKDKLINMFEESGWNFLEFINLNKEYKKWYFALLNSLKLKQNTIIKQFGKETYQKALNRYTEIYDYLSNDFLGGGIFYAQPNI